MLEVTDPKQSDEPMYFTESLVVADYIAEHFGQDSSLYPSSAKDRATVRLFTELCGGSAFSYFPLLRAKDDKEKETALQTLKDGLVGADAFLKHYKSGPFLLKDKFSLAECNAAPFVQRACTILPAFANVDPLQLCQELGLNHLQQWMKAVVDHPSVSGSGVPKEKLLESTTKMLERFAAMEQK